VGSISTRDSVGEFVTPAFTPTLVALIVMSLELTVTACPAAEFTAVSPSKEPSVDVMSPLKASIEAADATDGQKTAAERIAAAMRLIFTRWGG